MLLTPNNKRRSAATGGRLVCLLLPAVLTAMPIRGQTPSPGNLGDSLPPLATISTIRALDQKEREKPYPVRIEGRVLIYLRSRNIIVLSDGNQALSVFASQRRNLKAGQKIAVAGFTMSQRRLHVFANKIEILDETVVLPKPEEMSIGQIVADTPDSKYVTVTGVVKTSVSRNGRHEIRLRDRNDQMDVHVFRSTQGKPPSNANYSKLRFTGVIGTAGTNGTGPRTITLLVPDWRAAEMIKPAPKSPFNRDRKDVAYLRQVKPTRVLEYRTRARGEVVDVRENGLVILRDDTGEIPVRLSPRSDVKPGEVLDVVAFTEPDDSGAGIMLERASMRRLSLPQSKLARIDASTAKPSLEDYLPVAQNIREIRRLHRSLLAVGPPVRTRANAIYRDTKNSRWYVQGRSGGIAVEGITDEAGVSNGTLVEIIGFAKPGQAAPLIQATETRVIGTNLIAKPITGSSGNLALGRYDSQWISLDGVGRLISGPGNEVQLLMARTERKIPVRIQGTSATEAEKFVNADIIVNGIARTLVDENGVNRGSEILVAKPTDIVVEEPAPEDPFSIATEPIGRLKSFRADAAYTKRNRTTGVVTLAWPNLLFLNDGTNTIEVRVAKPTGMVPGERVDVLGFPRMTRLGMTLEDTVIRPLGRAELPQARNAAGRNVMSDGEHGELVTLSGELLKQVSATPDHLLVLQADSGTFPVVLPEMFLTPSIERLVDGSRLRVSGILSLQADDAGRPHSFRVLLPDADSVQLLQAPPWWTPGRLTLALAILAALTALILLRVEVLQRRARKSETRFDQTVNSSPVAIGIIAADSGRIVEVNEQFLDLLEFSRAQTTGKTLTELNIWPDAPAMTELREVADKSGPTGNLEAMWSTSKGLNKHVIVAAQSIELDQMDCLLVSAMDVTERFQLLDQLRDSQKLEAVGKLAAGIAHDFNNLLTIIKGNAEILQEELEDNEELSELNNEVDRAAARAAELTGQLLAFSRKQMMQMRAVNLLSLIKNSQRMLRRLLPATIHIETHLPDRIPVVHADAGMLEQILINLAVNARDAMPEGGRLTISLDTVELDAAAARLHPDAPPGAFVRLRVTDTGEGMDEVTKGRVFEPFFTTKDVGKGTGLGLATVYGIVRQHRGWLNVNASPGKGAEFQIHLPILADAEEATEEDTRTRELPRGTEKILLVEDEAGVRRIARSVLSRIGYQVTDAANAGEALRIWSDRKDEFDLLLTDVIMPGGVNGVELARRLTEERPNLKVVFISGYTDRVDSNEDIERLGGHLLEKPFAQADLAIEVRTVLDGIAVDMNAPNS